MRTNTNRIVILGTARRPAIALTGMILASLLVGCAGDSASGTGLGGAPGSAGTGGAVVGTGGGAGTGGTGGARPGGSGGAPGACAPLDLLFPARPNATIGFLGLVRQIQTDESYAYFTAGAETAVFRVPLAGGEPARIDVAGSRREPDGLWLYKGGFLLYFQGAGARIATMPLAGGPLTTVAALAGTPLESRSAELWLDGDLLYGIGYEGDASINLADHTAGIYTVDLVKGTHAVVREGHEQMSDTIAKSGDKFFFSLKRTDVAKDPLYGYPWALYSVGSDGTGATPLQPDLSFKPLLADEKFLYLHRSATNAATAANAAWTYRLPLAGGDPEALDVDRYFGADADRIASIADGNVLLAQGQVWFVPRAGGPVVYVGCSTEGLGANFNAVAVAGKSVLIGVGLENQKKYGITRLPLP